MKEYYRIESQITVVGQQSGWRVANTTCDTVEKARKAVATLRAETSLANREYRIVKVTEEVVE